MRTAAEHKAELARIKRLLRSKRLTKRQTRETQCRANTQNCDGSPASGKFNRCKNRARYLREDVPVCGIHLLTYDLYDWAALN